MSFFLTGTDTGVGKTTSAAMLLLRYQQLMYWKPVQTGLDFDRATVAKLSGLAEQRFLAETYSFPDPLSPHRAAELVGQQIKPEKIIADLRVAEQKARELGSQSLLIEGAGGLLVPLTRDYTWLDFLVQTKLSVVIVARTALGTINHSLLTVEMLRNYDVNILGFIFCGPPNADNLRTISEFSRLPVLCCFDFKQEKDLKKVAWQSCRDFYS